MVKDGFYGITDQEGLDIPEFAILVWYGFGGVPEEYKSARYRINQTTKNLEFLTELQVTPITIPAETSPNPFKQNRPQAVYSAAGTLRVVLPDPTAGVGWISWDPVSGDLNSIPGQETFDFFGESPAVIVNQDVYLVTYVTDFVGSGDPGNGWTIRLLKANPDFTSVSAEKNIIKNCVDVFGGAGTSGADARSFRAVWMVDSVIFGEYEIFLFGFVSQIRRFAIDLNDIVTDEQFSPSGFEFPSSSGDDTFIPYAFSDSDGNCSLFCQDGAFLISGAGDPLLRRVFSDPGLLDFTSSVIWPGSEPFTIPFDPSTSQKIVRSGQVRNGTVGVFYTARTNNTLEDTARGYVIANVGGTVGDLYTIEPSPFDFSNSGLNEYFLRGVFFEGI